MAPRLFVASAGRKVQMQSAGSGHWYPDRGLRHKPTKVGGLSLQPGTVHCTNTRFPLTPQNPTSGIWPPLMTANGVRLGPTGDVGPMSGLPERRTGQATRHPSERRPLAATVARAWGLTPSPTSFTLRSNGS